ncbi:MAG TPA: JDVT-CTERM system glutamic-type intramembrane protease [Ideonella sp.]|nr:JDVT-CTERM system glutamic-type intramembrane protease [Ideonella sp.]
MTDLLPALLPWLCVAGLGLLWLPPGAFVYSICLAPWLEETVLRWGLQDPLAARLPAARQWLAPLLAASVFAALHMLLAPSLADLPRAAATLLPAWWIGHVYRRRQRIAPCAAWHAGFNLAWLAGLSALAAPLLPHGSA